MAARADMAPTAVAALQDTKQSSSGSPLRSSEPAEQQQQQQRKPSAIMLDMTNMQHAHNNSYAPSQAGAQNAARQRLLPNLAPVSQPDRIPQQQQQHSFSSQAQQMSSSGEANNLLAPANSLPERNNRPDQSVSARDQAPMQQQQQQHMFSVLINNKIIKGKRRDFLLILSARRQLIFSGFELTRQAAASFRPATPVASCRQPLMNSSLRARTARGARGRRSQFMSSTRASSRTFGVARPTSAGSNWISADREPRAESSSQ